MFNLIKPFAGFLYTQKIHTMHTVVSELMDIMERKKLVLTPALACGYYKDGQ